MPNPDVLIIDSLAIFGAAISIPCQKGGKGPLRLVGSETPASAGNLRSSITAEFRTWNVTSARLDSATEDAIQTRIKRRRQLYCSGALLNNVVTLCSIECTASEMQEGTTEYVLQLIVREV